MPRQLAALLTVLLLSACSIAQEPAGLSDIEPASGHPNDREIERSRWVGIGSTDACGLSWAFDLVQDGNKVSGHLLWETVRYDLSGTIAPNDILKKARAGKSSDFTGTPAPRHPGPAVRDRQSRIRRPEGGGLLRGGDPRLRRLRHRGRTRPLRCRVTRPFFSIELCRPAASTQPASWTASCRKLSARRGGARSGGSLRNPPRGRRGAARTRFPELKSSLVLTGNAPRLSRRRRLRKSNSNPWVKILWINGRDQAPGRHGLHFAEI